MARDAKQKLAAERTVKLPRHVRLFTRQSRKGLPAPACAVALERGIRIPMPDGTHQIAHAGASRRAAWPGPPGRAP